MSAIYIPGMEMPKNEPLLVKINPDGSVSTTARNGYRKYKAIPVPDHGRLIDADALKENWCLTEFGNKVVEVAEIDGAPTIIPASKEGEE